MKALELRKLNDSDLVAKADELKIKIQDLKFQKSMGGEMNTALLGYTKKDLSRILTILKENKAKAEGAKK